MIRRLNERLLFAFLVLWIVLGILILGNAAFRLLYS